MIPNSRIPLQMEDVRPPIEIGPEDIATLEHVTKSFGDKLALNDISFDIPAGQVRGLVGPNGAGKTIMATISARSRPHRAHG